jgi:hypothetical protein
MGKMECVLVRRKAVHCIDGWEEEVGKCVLCGLWVRRCLCVLGLGWVITWSPPGRMSVEDSGIELVEAYG